METVQELFDKNGIRYTHVNNVLSFNGYNYSTAKTEAVNIRNENIIAVSANQPKSVLLKVLMEPVSRLSDSATYDITAWSLPYVYGVNAFASRDEVRYSEVRSGAVEMDMNPAYAYVIPVSAANGKIISSLLNANLKVRYNEVTFTSGNKTYKPGSLILLSHDNKGRDQDIFLLCKKFNVSCLALSSGMVDKGFDFGSDKVHLVKKPTVGLVTGLQADAHGAGEVWHLFEQQLNYPVNLYNPEDINADVLRKTDVLIFPNGRFNMLTDKDMSTELRNWVKQGGKIIAMENAVSQMAGADWGMKLKKADEDKKEGGTYADIKKYETRERDGVASNIPGAIYKTELDNTHPLAFGYPDYYFTLKQNTDVYEFMKEGWNVAIIKKEKQVAGFVGSKIQNKIQDGTVMGVQEMGRGHIIYFADDPIFRSFWENGKLLLENAVFLVGN
jgi:hypothetical protein